MSMRLGSNASGELLFAGFNQNYECFACGTESGFRIFTTQPFRETFRRDFAGGGIGIVEMLFRCNLLALVGGGTNPLFPPNRVMIWDDHQNRCIGELSFRSDVYSVRLRRDRIVVVLLNKIYVYNFADLRLVDHIETIRNPRGLCSMSSAGEDTVLACPGLQRGSVRVELYNARKTTLISAHESDLSAIALNQRGTRVATASDKGTLIRIFDTRTGQLQQELRRGADRAEIFSVAFDSLSRHLACSSDKGTVHVFRLAAADAVPEVAPDAGEGEDDKDNSKSSLSFMKGFLPKYFSSEWSFAQFHVPDARTIVAFGEKPYSIVTVSADGTCMTAYFGNGGECERTSTHRFLDPGTPILSPPASVPPPP